MPQVDLVLLPALTGDFGVMPGHVPTVAQLRPGVVTVHKTLDKEIEKYFVSSGFAFVHADSSTDVCAIEAVKLEDLDPEAVRAGLQVLCCSHHMVSHQQRVTCSIRSSAHPGPCKKQTGSCPRPAHILCPSTACSTNNCSSLHLVFKSTSKGSLCSSHLAFMHACIAWMSRTLVCSLVWCFKRSLLQILLQLLFRVAHSETEVLLC